MSRGACYEVGVPGWFLLVGAIATVYPRSSPIAGILTFVFTLVIVPLLTLAVDQYLMRRVAKRVRASPLLSS
jgi:hypothetical protein